MVFNYKDKVLYNSSEIVVVALAWDSEFKSFRADSDRGLGLYIKWELM